MDSESSLVLLDQSSSFQLLDKSESFDFIEPTDVVAQFDAEDEWLQLETGSVISSMASVLKADGSIMSEYSILDNVHAAALNEGGKLIKTRPDIYVEDLTMRKILEYLSMFSDEVADCLKASRSQKSLISSQIMSEDWEISSLIDLDDISPEALGLLLDTLEEFGMYKLCLIVCNRYNLASRLGRYIVALASRYSNLSEIRYKDVINNAQVQRAAIAYTAVHNMLEMINPEYIKLKENDEKNLGIEAFRGLILLGYWKKTVYIMDYDSSLAITSSFGDFKNFRQVFLARNGIKNYDLNEENFAWVKLVNENLITDDIYKIALDAVICNLNGMKGLGQNRALLTNSNSDFPKFPDFFSNNSFFWRYLLKKLPQDEFLKQLRESIKVSYSCLVSKNESAMKFHDIFSMYAQLILVGEEPIVYEALFLLNFEDFEGLMKIFNLVCLELTSKLYPTGTENLFSVLAPLGIRKVVPSEILAIYPFITHALIHKSSILLSCFNILPNEIIIPDIEASYLLCPLITIKTHLFQLFISKITKIMSFRASFLLKTTENELFTRVNLFGEIWMMDFIKKQFSYVQHKLDSYNYCKLDSKVLAEYKTLQNRLQDILQLCESDYYSEIFIRSTKNTEIKSIEKRIKEIEKMSSKDDVLGREESILKIVKLVALDNSHVKITKNAELAILTQAQSYVNNAEGAPKKVAHTYMWIVYHLCKVINRADFFVEILRNRHRKVLAYGKKVSKVSQDYESDLGFADVDVYFSCGSMKEVVSTVFSLFDFEFAYLDLDIKINLLYKATVAWASSCFDEFFASETLSKLFKDSSKEPGIFLVKSVLKEKFSPKALIAWILAVNKELSLTETHAHLKKEFSYSIYEMLFIIIKHCDIESQLIHDFKIPENQIILQNIELNWSLPFTIFSSLRTESDIRDFQRSVVLPSQVLCKVISRLPVESCNSMLDLEWIKQMKKIACDLKLSKLVIKNAKKIEKRKKIVNQFASIAYHYSVSRSAKMLPKLYTYSLELMQMFYNVSLKKVLDFHHILSKFSYVGELVMKIKDWQATEEEVMKTLEEVTEDMEDFKSWKKAITPEVGDPKAVYKKKFKMRWPLRFRYAKKYKRY